MSNDTPRRTAVSTLTNGASIGRGTFLQPLNQAGINLRDLVALGNTGSNREWHAVFKTSEQALKIAKLRQINIAGQLAGVVMLRPPPPQRSKFVFFASRITYPMLNCASGCHALITVRCVM